ncbi:putative zinc-binding dehydrogenase family [Rosellinia necatrix]|uniref:Putative zinc-binding dehydrogenase family n=1 Tax=Rosellinia necatrix TaxID=77044 RepID=A0A1S7UP18_ROSNE|nr:putative zinc-binding dehydrogenase family [Rosellinia necatrix]
MSLPACRSAIVCVSDSPGANLAVAHDVPMPLPLRPGCVLVRNFAVGLNPCDWKMPDKFPSRGSIGGSDFAGIIVALSDHLPATHPHLAVGDRVCGAVHGFDPSDHASGSFADYVVAVADILMKIPDGVSWAEAAAIGGTSIAALGIAFHDFLLPSLSLRKQDTKAEPASPVLVYGGGTATGTMAIQLLKASGFRPLAVCSAESAQLALSYGAERAFDYTSTSCADEIRTYTEKRLAHVLDIIADSDSVKLCYQAMGRLGGRYVGLELPPEDQPRRQLVHTTWVMGQTIFGNPLQLSGGYERPATPAHRKLGRRWFLDVQDLWHRGGITSHPVKDGGPEGLDGVVKGINLLRQRKVARQKLVYRLY